MTAARNRLRLCSYEYQTYMGEYAAMIDALEEEQTKDPSEDREHWLKSSFFLIEARCMLGRELDAQQLARTVSRHLGDTDRPPAQLEEAFARHAFLVLLLSGQWRKCIELMRRTPSGSSRLQYRGCAH